MVQSLEEYVAQATNAYKPAQTAIQSQLDSLSGQLETANQQINKNYAQQQAGLNRQRNMAAETASMQAAGSGGSFGGAANLANRKYYDQSFVPAQTQLQTNQANELAQARQNIENQRTSLNSQLSNLESQANQQALQQYWAAQEAEAQREAQLRAQREANAAQDSYYRMLMDEIKASGGNSQISSNTTPSFIDWIKNSSGWKDSKKEYWVNNVTGILNRTGATGAMMQTALNKALLNTPEYKQYLAAIGQSVPTVSYSTTSSSSSNSSRLPSSMNNLMSQIAGRR